MPLQHEMDHLSRSFEALKSIQLPSQLRLDTPTPKSSKKDVPPSKREKIIYCHDIVDGICSNQNRTLDDLQKLLDLSIESLLICCNDNDGDVRLIANDCLNRLINHFLDRQLNRIQVVLYKEIKKNGPSLCLKAALSRFSYLAHLIRPSKCRPFLVNLIPCLLTLAERQDDEIVQECIATHIRQLTSNLIRFGKEIEIQQLISAYVGNLFHENLVCKRTAAICLLAICEHFNRQALLLNFLFDQLFEYDIKLDPQCVQLNRRLVGMFLCVKHLLPLLSHIPHESDLHTQNLSTTPIKQKTIFNTSIQLLRQNLLRFSRVLIGQLRSNSDPQVILALLELLKQLLSTPPKLISSMFSSIGLQIQSDRLSQELSQITLPSSFHLSPSDDCPAIDYEFEVDKFLSTIAQLILDRFLIKNVETNQLYDDKDVKVSLKGLALSCVASLVQFNPHCLETSPAIDLSDVVCFTRLKIVLQYGFHSDPQLRSQCCLIASQFITSCLDLPESDCDPYFSLINQLFVGNIFQSILDDSSVCSKNALIALSSCVNSLLLHSNILGPTLLDLLRHLIQICPDSYWLIKVEIVQLFAQLDYSLVYRHERQTGDCVSQDDQLQSLVIENIFLALLSDSDHRVRQAVCCNLPKLVYCLYFDDQIDEIDCCTHRAALQHEQIKLMDTNAFHRQTGRKGLFSQILQTNQFDFVFPFSDQTAVLKYRCKIKVSRNLKIVVTLLKQRLISSLNNRVQLFGLLNALSDLSNAFATTKFVQSWMVDDSELNDFLEFLLHLITTYATVEMDLTLHGFVVNLLGNLSSGHAFHLLEINNYGNNAAEIVEENVDKQQAKKEDSPSSSRTSVGGINNNKSNMTAASFSITSGDQSLQSEAKQMTNFDSPLFNQFLFKFCQHLMQVLQILQTQFHDHFSQTTKPSLAQNLSPLKRRNTRTLSETIEKSDLLKKVLDSKLTKSGSIGSASSSSSSSSSTAATNAASTTTTASFSSSSSSSSYLKANLNEGGYTKLQQVIASNMYNTRNSLDFFHLDEQTDRFGVDNRLIQFVQTILGSFGQLLEFASVRHFGKYADKLLQTVNLLMFYMQSDGVVFVRQLLKCIFSTNFASIITMDNEKSIDFFDQSLTESDLSDRSHSSMSQGLFHVCIQSPYEEFLMKASRSNQDSCGLEPIYESDEFFAVTCRKNFEKRLTLSLNLNFGPNSTNLASLSQYIRLFEPVVMKSLKMYTLSNHQALQCQVLSLLRHLIKLRVNYLLLDNEQVFITFLHKQFDFIEQSQLIDCEPLIYAIYRFMILLSYDQYHSRPITNLSRIIRLIDSLIVATVSYDQCIFPALKVIIEDLFLVRGGASSDSVKDLETLKEVTMNTLFKLLHQPKTVLLLNIIVNQSRKECEEKFRKCSRLVVDQLLPMLARQQIHVQQVDDLKLLMDILDSVSPTVFRPIDFVLNGLFSSVDNRLLNDTSLFCKFITHKVLLLKVALVQSKEDMLLARLEELRTTMNRREFEFDLTAQNKSKGLFQPIHILFLISRSKSADHHQHHHLDEQPVEQTFLTFLFKLIHLTIEQLVLLHQQSSSSQHHLSFKQLLATIVDLQFTQIQHILQGTEFRRLSRFLVDFAAKPDDVFDLDQIGQLLLHVGKEYVQLLARWSHLLVLMNCASSQKGFVSSLLQLANQTSATTQLVQLMNSFQQSQSHCNIFWNLDQLRNRHLQSANSLLVRKFALVNAATHFTLHDPPPPSPPPPDLLQQQFLLTNALDVVQQFNFEPPLVKFISSLNNDKANSEQFVQVIETKFDESPPPSVFRFTFLRKLLDCVEFLHEQVSAAIVRFLVHKLFTNPACRHMVVIQTRVSQILLCRLETLLNADTGEQEQLDVQQIDDMLQQVSNQNSDIKFALQKYRNKLAGQADFPEFVATHQEAPVSILFEVNKEMSKDQLFRMVANEMDSSLIDSCVHVLNTKCTFLELFHLLTTGGKDFDTRIHFLSCLLRCLCSQVERQVSLERLKELQKQATILDEPSLFGKQAFNILNAAMKSALEVMKQFLNDQLEICAVPYVPYVAYEQHLLTEQEITNWHHLNGKFDQKLIDNQLIAFVPMLKSFLQLIQAINLLKCTQLTDEPDSSPVRPAIYRLSSSELQLLLRFTTVYGEHLQHRCCSDRKLLIEVTSLWLESVANDRLFAALRKHENTSFQITWIAVAHCAVASLDSSVRKSDYESFLDAQEMQLEPLLNHTVRCCLQMQDLLDWVQQHSLDQHRKLVIADDIQQNIFELILFLARLPLVNSYVLVPSIVWKEQLWKPRFVCTTKRNQSLLEHLPNSSRHHQPMETLDYTNEMYADISRMCGTLPSEILSNEDCLQQFLYRINLIGFCNRIQFEEIWMSLLGVISTANTELSKENVADSESFAFDQKDLLQLIVLAVRGINSLLLQCKLRHKGFVVKEFKARHKFGWSCFSSETIINETGSYVGRKVFFNTKFGSKLLGLKEVMRHCENNTLLFSFDQQLNEHFVQRLMLGNRLISTSNLIKFGDLFYGNLYGSTTVDTLRKNVGLSRKVLTKIDSSGGSSSSSSSSPVHHTGDTFNSRRSSKATGVDIFRNRTKSRETLQQTETSFNDDHTSEDIDLNSCVHFLLDLYSQLNGHQIVQLQVVKSSVRLSDTFFDVAQFHCLLERFFDQFKLAFAQEDEILMQYLIVGICKFYAVINAGGEGEEVDNLTFDKLRKAVEICLHSHFLPTQLNCLLGVEFILQQRCVDQNSGISVSTKEMPLFVALKEHIVKHLNEIINPTKSTGNILELDVLIWSLVFTVIETFVEDFQESDFSQKVFQAILHVLNHGECMQSYLLVTRGVQSLLVSEYLQIKDCEVLLRICNSKLKTLPFSDYRFTACFHILVTSIYVFGLSPTHHHHQQDKQQSDFADEILNLESVTLLFECARHSVCRSQQLLLQSLPYVSLDFLPEHNLLNKIISQFVSSSTENFDQFAILLHKVFGILQAQSKQLLINEWVCLSINSITQIKPLQRSRLSLVLFLISASSNVYIKSLFRYVLSNHHCLKADTSGSLIQSLAANFCDELNEDNRRTFISGLCSTSEEDGGLYLQISNQLSQKE